VMLHLDDAERAVLKGRDGAAYAGAPD
jgi:hypothetical protein